MEALLVSVIVVLGLASFVVWIWALVDILKVPSDDRFRTGSQLIWVLVVVFTQIIGAIIYVVIGRPEPGKRR